VRIAMALFSVVCAGQNLIPPDAATDSPPETQLFRETICLGAAECTVCPADTGFAGKASWNLRSITFGHFLGAKSEDALVGGWGCEDHADGLSGAYLFTKDQSSWLKVWYSPRMNVSDCKKLTSLDGRDLLVCAASDMHFGVGDWFLYLVDPGLDPRQQPDTWDIFFAVDDSLGGCVKYPGDAYETGIIESVSFVPLPTPPSVRIDVSARVGKAVIPDKIMATCVEGPKPTIATVSQRYEFVFDGRKIVPDPKNPPTEYATAIAPATSYQPTK
jgi:hypothetical protein